MKSLRPFWKILAFLPYLDMGVAPTVAMGQLVDGSISILACSISNYLCTNFGAFIKKCTIDQLIYRKQFSEPSSYDIDINFQNNCNFDVDLSVSRIKSILNNLDINKAQGPDNINGTVLKHCSESLAYPLSKLFKLTYNVGCLQSEWKTSNIGTVHIKDNKSNVQNYHQISLTSLVMKVYERILYEELLYRTESKIDQRQHGFLRNKSCNTNLLSFTNSIASSLHDKTGVDAVYFDFAKAFDTVSHDL